MIEVLDRSTRKILAVKVKGTLTREDYEKVLIPRYKKIMRRYSRGRLFFVMDKDFKGMDASAVWDDIRFALIEGGFFLEKMAVVGAPRWFEAGVHFLAHFIHGEVQTFPASQREKAWAWVSAPPKKPKTVRKPSPAAMDL
jgi:hypothetical protein